MSNQNQNGNNQGNNLPANAGQPGTPEKKGGLKTFLDNVHKKYDAIRYSKTGKWVARGLTLLAVGGTAKTCFDKGFKKGQASVTPTVVTIEKLPETETPAETPAEEKSEVEETA